MRTGSVNKNTNKALMLSTLLPSGGFSAYESTSFRLTELMGSRISTVASIMIK